MLLISICYQLVFALKFNCTEFLKHGGLLLMVAAAPNSTITLVNINYLVLVDICILIIFFLLFLILGLIENEHTFPDLAVGTHSKLLVVLELSWIEHFDAFLFDDLL